MYEKLYLLTSGMQDSRWRVVLDGDFDVEVHISDRRVVLHQSLAGLDLGLLNHSENHRKCRNGFSACSACVRKQLDYIIIRVYDVFHKVRLGIGFDRQVFVCGIHFPKLRIRR